MSLETQIVHDIDSLNAVSSEWEALADAAGQPFLHPTWQLGWWRHRRPAGATLSVVLVREDGVLRGVAPWFIQRPDAKLPEYRLIGARSFFRIAPLAAPGRMRETAVAVAKALAEAGSAPAVARFEGVDHASEWPLRLAAAWPQGPAHVDTDRAATLPGPTMAIDPGGLDAWLASRSRNFRQQMRSRRRRAERLGGAVRIARTAEEFIRDFDGLRRLHHSRWNERGGSGALSKADESLILEAGASLAASARARLFTLDINGRPAASYLFVAAGGEVSQYVMGFDPAWSELSPGLLTLIAAIEDASARGDRRLDFGAGAEPYKYRFADRDEPLVWRTIVPPGRTQIRARGRLVAEHSLSRARVRIRKLPPPARRALKGLLGR